MTGWRQEAEPLAFRVRPFPGEYFDCWLDRVVSRHETSRAALFRHLGLDPPLATNELGLLVSGSTRDKIVARLAWATDSRPEMFAFCFITAPGRFLLPAIARVRGCPMCALEWLNAGEPYRIVRHWVFRISWRCQRHGMILSDLRHLTGVSRPSKHVLVELRREIRRQLDLEQSISFDQGRTAVSSLAIKHLTAIERSRPVKAVRDYLEEIGQNRFHFATSGPALLADWHSHEPEASKAFLNVITTGFGGHSWRPDDAGVVEPELQGLVDAIALVKLRHIVRDAQKYSALAKRLPTAKDILKDPRERLNAASIRLEWLHRNYRLVRVQALARRRWQARLAEFKERFAIELAGLSQAEQEGCEALLTSLAYLQDAGRHVDADLIVDGLARRSQGGRRQLAIEEVCHLQSLLADYFSSEFHQKAAT